MAFLEFNGYRKLRTIENGKYSDSDNRMNRREAELYFPFSIARNFR